jgi:hypothetical protein
MKAFALLLSLALAPLAHAQSDKGMYFGAGLGSFDYDETSSGSFLGVNDSSYAYHLFGGYKFNEHIALEGGMSGTGELEETIPQTLQGIGTVDLNFVLRWNIYKVNALGILPFDKFSLFGGVGYFSASLDGDVEAPGFGSVGTVSDHMSGADATFGIQRDFGLDLKSVSVRGQFDWYDFDHNVDVSGITLAVLFRF